MKKYFLLFALILLPISANAASWGINFTGCNRNGTMQGGSGCRLPNGEVYVLHCGGSVSTNKDTYNTSESVVVSGSVSGLADPGQTPGRCTTSIDSPISQVIALVDVPVSDVSYSASGSTSFTAPATGGSYSIGAGIRLIFPSVPVGATRTGTIPYTVASVSQCSDSLNNDNAQGADAADPECHTDCNVNNAVSYVPSHNSESVGPNGSCGGSETNMVDIGWDNALTTKTKNVTLQSGQTSMSDTIYLSSWDWNALTAGRCSLKKRNGAGWDYVPSVDYFSQNTGTFSYTVSGLTAGTHEYQYECKKASWASDPVTKVSASATITVAAYVGNPVVSCTPSPQASPATFNWSATDFTNQAGVVCTVDGAVQGTGVASGSFSRTPVGTYGISCTDGTQTRTASCVVTVGTPQCGDAVCNGTETCGSCPTDCGACTLGAACLTSPTVPTLVTNENFSVAVPFTNTGSKPWDPGLFTYRSNSVSSFAGWNGVTRLLGSYIAGTPSSGIFNSSFSFTAPGSAGTYPLSFRMSENGTMFGASNACLVNGTGNVQVRAPQCSDGVDNVDSEDTIVDAADPGCIANGVYNPNDDDEQDPAPAPILRVSANPQLVRQGGSSTGRYEVNGCVTNPGNVPATWQFRRDGVVIASGTGTSSGERTYLMTNIQNKTTLTISCGSTTRSATVSVIKVSEF